MAQSKSKPIQCVGYTLGITNDPDDGRSLALVVHDSKGKEYELRVDDPDDRPGLVMEMFDALKVWPSRSFFITADGDNVITSFSLTEKGV